MKAILVALLVCSALWAAITIGIIEFQASDLNSWLITKLGNGISISDGINLGVAIGTIGAVITSLYLYKKSENANYISMAKTQRAYIALDKVEIIKIQDNINDILITLTFKNAGLSVAKNIRYLSSFNYYEDTNNLPTIDCINEDNLTRVNICASNSVFTANHLVKSSDILSNRNDNKNLYFYGLIEYNDIYSNEKHRTKFSKWVSVDYYSKGLKFLEYSGKVNDIS